MVVSVSLNIPAWTRGVRGVCRVRSIRCLLLHLIISALLEFFRFLPLLYFIYCFVPLRLHKHAHLAISRKASRFVLLSTFKSCPPRGCSGSIDNGSNQNINKYCTVRHSTRMQTIHIHKYKAVQVQAI